MAELFFTNQDSQSSQIITIKLADATDPFFIRLTGGAGGIDERNGKVGVHMLSRRLATFSGILIQGGTRVINKATGRIHPSIQEVGPRIKTTSGGIRVFGIVPRPKVLKIGESGLVISENEEQLTIVNPDHDIVLVVQKNVDDVSLWDTEWRESFRIIDQFRQYSAKYRCALVCYDGGSSVIDEVRLWAAYKWPVLLIKDSGRFVTELARDVKFLREFPSVRAIDFEDLAGNLRQLGAKI